MIEIVHAVGIQEARSRLTQLCGDVAESGEPVILCRRGEPVVEVRPLRSPAPEPSSPEAAEPSPDQRGILECLRDCEARFGPLEGEFNIPPRTASPLDL